MVYVLVVHLGSGAHGCISVPEPRGDDRTDMVPGGGKGAMEPRPSSPIPKERAIRVTDVGTPQKAETSPRGDSNGKESPHPPETRMEGVRRGVDGVVGVGVLKGVDGGLPAA